MKRVILTVEGHSADMYVGIGFVPEVVYLQNMTGDLETCRWYRIGGAAAAGQGVYDTGADLTLLSTTTTINAYDGGYLVTTASEVYKMKDTSPNKISTITGWTTTAASTFKGKFNVAIDTNLTNYIAAGSQIIIDGRVYQIVTSDGTGTGDDSITLDRAPQNVKGDITFVSGPYTHIAAPANKVIPAGICIQFGALNADSDRLVIEAMGY